MDVERAGVVKGVEKPSSLSFLPCQDQLKGGEDAGGGFRVKLAHGAQGFAVDGADEIADDGTFLCQQSGFFSAVG